MVIGLAADAAACVLLLLLVGEVIPPVIVFGVLFAALAVGTARVSRRWPQVAALVLGVLFIGGNMPFIVEDLAHPDSIAGFAPTWLLILATLFVIVSAVMLLRRSESRARGLVVAFVAAAVVGVAGSALATAGVSNDVRQPGDVVIAAKDVEYPAEVRVPADTAILVENHDIFRHTFVVDGEDVKHQLPASTDRRVELTLQRGTYTFRCDVPGHEDMKGTLIIE